MAVGLPLEFLFALIYNYHKLAFTDLFILAYFSL